MVGCALLDNGVAGDGLVGIGVCRMGTSDSGILSVGWLLFSSGDSTGWANVIREDVGTCAAKIDGDCALALRGIAVMKKMSRRKPTPKRRLILHRFHECLTQPGLFLGFMKVEDDVLDESMYSCSDMITCIKHFLPQHAGFLRKRAMKTGLIELAALHFVGARSLIPIE